MYFWKCWYDTRERFLIFLCGFCSVMALAGYFIGLRAQESVAQTVSFWKDFGMICIPIGKLMPFAAVCIAGGAGIGEEFAAGSPVFLFTRPRRRRYFAWTSWAMGILELTAILVAAILGPLVIGLFLTHAITSWRFLLVFAYVPPVTAVVYGIGHLAAVLGKGARQGTAITLLAILAYIAVIETLSLKYRIDVPRWWLDQLASTQPTGGTAVLAIFGWLTFSLLFPFAAQYILQRREI